MKKRILCIALIVVVALLSGCNQKNNKIFNEDKGVYESTVELHGDEIPVAHKDTTFDVFGYDKPQTIAEDPLPELPLPDDPKLIINEAALSNFSTDAKEAADNFDWIELKNNSEKPLYLSHYWISDNINEPHMFKLPRVTLEPNQLIVLACEINQYDGIYSTGFKLDSKSEELYLSDEEGFVDYIHLENVPIGGSYGRMEDEDGYFYFNTQSPNEENTDGKRFVSEKPKSETRCGVYNGIESVTVKLSGKGNIYYTLDGSLPDESSTLYESEIVLKNTATVRAVAVQDGGVCSHCITIPFILNENHSFPVVSLVTDIPDRYDRIYSTGDIYKEQSGNIILFQNGEVFNMNCGISIANELNNSQSEKKSLKIQFRTAYGQSKLKCNLFNNGVNKYESLILRAGADSSCRLFNSEMWQELGYELNENIISQHTKTVILYVNGEYYGIYSLKENISRAYYADVMDVDEGSVSQSDLPDNLAEEFENDVYRFLKSSDMTKDENYKKISEIMDIDSFVDWCLIEGISGNDNLIGNVHAFKSTEGDGKWRFVLTNFDGAVKANGPWNVLFNRATVGAPNRRLSIILKSLLENDSFKDRFLRRYAEKYNTVFSNENIISTAEKFRQKYLPEIERDRSKWGYELSDWTDDVDSISKRIISKDWQNYGVTHLCRDILHMTQSDVDSYFPSLKQS